MGRPTVSTDEPITSIPLDLDLAAVIARRAESAGKSDDLPGYVHDVLEAAFSTREWFYGVEILLVNKDGPDWEWRVVAVDAAGAHVVDGALLFTDSVGITFMGFAPGRWKEFSRRLEVDRHMFNYEPVPEPVARAFKLAAARQQGWPPSADHLET